MGRPSDKAKLGDIKNRIEKMPAPAEGGDKSGRPKTTPGQKKNTDTGCPIVSARPEQQKP